MNSSDNLQPLLSICCTTYNHSRYIIDALNGFLAQDTSFPYEILIHDDASDDGTESILKRYERDFECIRVFYEETNQYNSGKYDNGYLYDILIPNAKGKYYSICEGDDYWCDLHKLENQVYYLENHPDCSTVIHSAYVLEGEEQEFSGIMGLGDKQLDMNTEQLLAKDWNIPTASRTGRIDDAILYRDEWTFDKPVGDFPSLLHASTLGYVHYDPSIMSVYRHRVDGSWSNRMLDDSYRLLLSIRFIEMLNNIDYITEKKFHLSLLQFSIPYVKNIVSLNSHYKISFYNEAKLMLNRFDYIECCIKRIFSKFGFRIWSSGYAENKRIHISRNSISKLNKK